MENSTYQQDNKHVSSTILHRLVNELDLTKVLTQYVSIIEGKPVDYLVNKLKTYEQQITDKDKFWNQLGFEIKNEHREIILVFWNQLGFEIKNEHREIILVLAKHSSLLELSTYQAKNKQMSQTLLRRLVEELGLNEILKQYILIDCKQKIDNLLTQLQRFEQQIMDENVIIKEIGVTARQIGTVINTDDTLLSLVKQHSFLLQKSNHCNKTILQRLVEELQISCLLNEYRIRTSCFEIKEHGLLNFSSGKININNTMDFIDNKHMIDNVHFSETQYQLVNMNNCTVLMLDEIYQYLENKVDTHHVDAFKNLIQNEEYDSDCVEYDMPNGNIFNCIQTIQKDEVIPAIQRIIIQSHINNKYKNIYLKHNESFNIFPGSYGIYFKNKKLFGDKYILLQIIDETYFKNCTTQFIDNLHIDAFNSISINGTNQIDTNLCKTISKYQFATNIINNPKNTKYTFENLESLDKFNIPIIDDNTQFPHDLYAKSVDNSFEWTKIKSFTQSKYKLEQDKPLNIDKTININKFDSNEG
eukprot:246643_1